MHVVIAIIGREASKLKPASGLTISKSMEDIFQPRARVLIRILIRSVCLLMIVTASIIAVLLRGGGEEGGKLHLEHRACSSRSLEIHVNVKKSRGQMSEW